MSVKHFPFLTGLVEAYPAPALLAIKGRVFGSEFMPIFTVRFFLIAMPAFGKHVICVGLASPKKQMRRVYTSGIVTGMANKQTFWY